MRRDVTKDIWRAVVVAGAMLSAGAGCSSGPKQETTPTVSPAMESEQAAADKKKMMPPDAGVAKVDPPDAAPPPPPDAAPPKPPKRPRGTGGKPRGRGFVLA